jgi:hypothetical protein
MPSRRFAIVVLRVRSKFCFVPRLALVPSVARPQPRYSCHFAYRRSTFHVAKVIPDPADLTYVLDINPEKKKMQTYLTEKWVDVGAESRCFDRAHRTRAIHISNRRS